MIPDISELLAFHEDPEQDTGGETLSHLIESIPRHGVGVLLSELPEEWRRALITWLVEAYDNALDGDDFVYINNPEGRLQEEGARAWMRSTPGYPDYVINDIPSLLSMTERRIFSRDDLMNQLVRISALRGPTAVFGELPDHWKMRFITWVRNRIMIQDDSSLYRAGAREVRDWMLDHSEG